MRLDTRNGTSRHTATFDVERNQAYLIFLASDGVEIDRMTGPRRLSRILSTMAEMLRNPVPDRPATLAYLFSHQPITEAVREKVDRELRLLDHSVSEFRKVAAGELVRMGYPAYVILSKAKPDDPGDPRKIRSILRKLRPLHKTVTQRRLDHDVGFLVKLRQRREVQRRAASRLKAILPEEAPERTEALLEWWQTRRDRYRWDAVKQRFVRKK